MGDKERNVNIIIKARNEASKALDSVLASVGTLTGAAAAAAAGAAYMAYAFTKVTEAAMQQENADVRLAAALASIGQNTAGTREHLSKFIAQLEDVTGVSDETIQSTVALLVQLGHLSGQGLEDATQAALDLSTVMGTDLQSAAMLVAKASEGNAAALKRVGVVIDETLPKAERMKQLNEQLGDAAAAAGTTLEKAFARIANSFDNLEQAIGKTVIENEAFRALLAIVNDLLKESTHWVEGNTGAFDQLITAVARGTIAFLRFSLEVVNAEARQAEFLLTMGQVAASVASLASVAPAMAEKIFGIGGGLAKDMAKGAADVILALQSMKNVAGGVSQATAAAIETIEAELKKLSEGGFKAGQTFKNQVAPGVEALNFELELMVGHLDDAVPNLTKLDDIMQMLGGQTLLEVATQAAAVDSALNQIVEQLQAGLISPEQFDALLSAITQITQQLPQWSEDLRAANGHAIFISDTFTELSDVVEGQATAAILKFSDTAIDAALGAQVNWHRFFKQLLADILKAIAEMLILKAISLAIGGGAGGSDAAIASSVGLGADFFGETASRFAPAPVVFPPSPISAASIPSLSSFTQPGAGPSSASGIQMFNQIVPLRDREAEIADLIKDISTAVERRGHYLAASRVVS